MKKKLILIVFALFLGGIMAFITYQKFKGFDGEILGDVTLYQLGVYESYENALAKKESFTGSLVVNKDNMYQVIGAIVKSEACAKKIEELLSEENITYYKKKIMLNEEDTKMVENYELLMEKADNADTLELINQELLKAILKEG